VPLPSASQQTTKRKTWRREWCPPQIFVLLDGREEDSFQGCCNNLSHQDNCLEVISDNHCLPSLQLHCLKIPTLSLSRSFGAKLQLVFGQSILLQVTLLSLINLLNVAVRQTHNSTCQNTIHNSTFCSSKQRYLVHYG
jgi:hypothetical protein